MDLEVNQNSQKIDNIGFLFNEIELTTTSLLKVKNSISTDEIDFICGHNFVDHDKRFLERGILNNFVSNTPIIDTLFLSMLLYPNKTTHKLDKPYKTELNIENQPLGDAKQTKGLLCLLDDEFNKLDANIKTIFYQLLKENKYFNGYFLYKKLNLKLIDIYNSIKDKIKCSKEEFDDIYKKEKTSLAFVISYLFSDQRASISYVILKKFPKVVDVLKKLTFKADNLELEKFAKAEFGIEKFKDFEVDTDKSKLSLFVKKTSTISQKDIIEASLRDKSLLAVLPTGGGKTLTFQLPALIKAKSYNALSIVISPLQALMKNHVDSFKDKNQNFNVIAISGYLSPIERMDALKKIENGTADILYIAPEALRSISIYKTIKRRIIDRFIIDEAHCFSSWGHDFRHDYFFIANTIKNLEEENQFQSKIPVSCFTATAKPEVIKDIKKYFLDRLSIELEEYIASTKRYNLEYEAYEVTSKHDKYEKLIEVLKARKRVPTIIYIPQNAKECKELSIRLNDEPRLGELDLVIEPFYSKIDYEIENSLRNGRNKGEILKDFIDNKIDIVVATTAFGMGIDKPDIQTIIHYEQSDSLESYLQESGRGARQDGIKAKCIVLFSKQDFNRTFAQLNRSKLEYQEIQRVVRELKKKKRNTLYLSPKEIAQSIGIDTTDTSIEYETLIKTALLELENADIIKRGMNSTNIFATSIDKEKRSMEYVHKVLDDKKDQYTQIYENMIIVMQNIIQRSKVDAIEVEDLSDIVSIKRKDMFEILMALQKEGLIQKYNDISINVKNSIKRDFNEHFKIEQQVFKELLEDLEFKNINLRELNDKVANKNSILTIKKIIQSWTHLAKLKENKMFKASFYKNICYFELDLENVNKFKHVLDIREKACRFIIDEMLILLDGKKESEVEVSTYKLKSNFDEIQYISLDGFHHVLVYLNDLIHKSFELRRGRLIYHQSYKIEKQESIKHRTPYKKRDHYNKSLKPYYLRKIEAIHIQLEFLKRLFRDGWEKTSLFVRDYFVLEYEKFKKKYGFNDKEIQLPITKEELDKILKDLNDEQKSIFDDKRHTSILVLAGPGSGKTKTLVHKIASLVTIENNKAEYFLMLAHSRVAVLEFRARLKKLIGDLANSLKIYTFHSFALQLLGKTVDNQDKLQNIIGDATKRLNTKEIQLPPFQMLVLDEYQDVGSKSYEFIKAIYKQLSIDKKIIAVGDDDQCINNFKEDGADIRFIKKFKDDFKEESDDSSLEFKYAFREYELTKNYRSRKNIVDFANDFTKIFRERLKHKRLKTHDPKDGKLEITYYVKGGNYIENLIKSIQNDNSNSIAILARNNDEVLDIYSSLIEKSIHAKYITSKNGFKLGNLVELRDFHGYLQNYTLNEAEEKFKQEYADSKNYSLSLEVINKFLSDIDDEIKENNLYLASLFKDFIAEIEFEEFEKGKSKVIVSTMHKAKGREFENVYICMQEDFIKTEYDKRLLYVAITRAKYNLFIHTKDDKIFSLPNQYFTKISNYTRFDKDPKNIIFEMGLGDIVLSNTYSQQGIKAQKLLSGQKAKIFKRGFGYAIYKRDKQIALLSSPTKIDRVSYKIEEKLSKGYHLLEDVDIEYVVLWKKDNEEKKQIICKIYMQKQ